MSEYDLKPRYAPEAPPPRPQQSREMILKRPYARVWIASDERPCVMGASHLRKSAEKQMRDSMYDGSTSYLNHHTRFYIWDMSFPGWDPNNLHCWTPIAERPKDQWVASR